MRLYTVAQAAEIMGSSERTLRRIMAAREIDYVIASGTKKISEDQIRAYIERNTVPSKP